jgi:hypothetical protein
MPAMSKKFDLPLWDYQSTGGARRAYAETYNRTWPFDDRELRALARDVPEDPADCCFNSRCQHLLNTMRECDPEAGQ